MAQLLQGIVIDDLNRSWRYALFFCIYVTFVVFVLWWHMWISVWTWFWILGVALWLSSLLLSRGRDARNNGNFFEGLRRFAVDQFFFRSDVRPGKTSISIVIYSPIVLFTIHSIITYYTYYHITISYNYYIYGTRAWSISHAVQSATLPCWASETQETLDAAGEDHEVVTAEKEVQTLGF